jgi:hypothetical protein
LMELAAAMNLSPSRANNKCFLGVGENLHNWILVRKNLLHFLKRLSISARSVRQQPHLNKKRTKDAV